MADLTISDEIRTDAMRADALATIVEKRQAAEEAGVLVDGNLYEATTEARLKLTTMLVFAVRDPNYSASVKLLDGNSVVLTAPQIYRVVTAMTNLAQTLAQWEEAAADTVANAANIQELEVVEAEVDQQTAPAANEEEPQPPEGAPPPPDFSKNEFEDLTCTGDVDIQRLYARDKLAVSSMYVDPEAKARKASYVLAGTFLSRRGDRQATKVAASLSSSDPGCAPRFVLYEPGRSAVLCIIDGVAGARLLQGDVSNTLFEEDSDECFEIDCYILNLNEKGSLVLKSYAITT